MSGKGFNPTWPPLYPWFISLFIRSGIGEELSGQLVSVIFGVLTVAMVYVVTRAIFSQTIAQTAALFSVFHPYLVRYSAETLADSMFTFLIISCVYCGWLLINRQRLISVFLCGALAGFAYLTKPEGLFLLVVISIWHRKIWHVFCMWAIFLLVSFPYLYAIHKETGRWMISQKESVVFSVALQEEGYTGEFLNISPLEYARGNPLKFFTKTGKGLVKLLGRFPDAYNPFLFILLIIGLMSGVREKRYLFYILSFLIPYFIGYAVFHPGRRYLVGWVPLTMFLAAEGAERFRKYTWVLVFVAILIMSIKTFESIRDDGRKWKEAGLWLSDNAGAGVKVMSEDSRVVFYAGAENVGEAEAGYIVTEDEVGSLRKVHRTNKGLNIYYAGD